jgi:hypothetical protein
MTSDDINEGEREIIKVRASTYTNYPTKKPNELTLDTEICKLTVTDRDAFDSAQFRLQSKGTENKEFTQRRLEAEALEALKEKEKEKLQKKSVSSPSHKNDPAKIV